jgi:hypothetical protein
VASRRLFWIPASISVQTRIQDRLGNPLGFVDPVCDMTIHFSENQNRDLGGRVLQQSEALGVWVRMNGSEGEQLLDDIFCMGPAGPLKEVIENALRDVRDVCVALSYFLRNMVRDRCRDVSERAIEHRNQLDSWITMAACYFQGFLSDFHSILIPNVIHFCLRMVSETPRLLLNLPQPDNTERQHRNASENLSFPGDRKGLQETGDTAPATLACKRKPCFDLDLDGLAQ